MPAFNIIIAYAFPFAHAVDVDVTDIAFDVVIYVHGMYCSL